MEGMPACPRAINDSVVSGTHRACAMGPVIAMNTLGREYHGLDVPEGRLQRDAGGANQVGQGRDAQGDAFQRQSFRLAVQRLVLAILVVDDHRQQAGAGKGAGDDVERCRLLTDRLAVAAGG